MSDLNKRLKPNAPELATRIHVTNSDISILRQFLACHKMIKNHAMSFFFGLKTSRIMLAYTEVSTVSNSD